jgi:peptide/nickel transport system substrate-binding protein
MMRRISMAAAIAAALAAQAPSGALAGKANDTMNIAWQFIVENPDNYFNTSREGILIARMVWDNLIERDPVTNEYKPMLATAWKWVDDLTLEFDIRSGVKWHDGAPLTADDVIFTFNWISNPENKVLNQSNVSWIKEATKIGDNKVRVSAKHPFPAALEFIAGPLVIYPKHYYEKAGPQGMSRQTVGSGPYKLVRHDPGKAMLFERNDAYWDGSPRGKGKVAKINARFIPEVTTQIAEVISGGLDWMWYVPPDQVEKLGRLPNVGVTAGETMRVGYLYLDAAGRSNPNSPLKDVRVRRAIAHAINRLEFVKSMFGGEARVIDAPLVGTILDK